jgi:putative membrane protein
MSEKKRLRDKNTEYARENTRLSHERTFLAWLRTGLACVAGGVVVMRLLFFENVVHQKVAEWSGVLLVAAGILIFLLTLIDYKKSSHQLRSKSGYLGSMVAVSTIVAILIIISVLLCFTIF